ncbi:MAG: PKD domain-containing protein, partial [Flavobacteriales bacterium]|nr:PKD domain-containing protein [Flavobacteriales bacterium]
VDNWEWDFGDATTSTQQNPTHTYATFGSYDVELVAVSNQGCGDTTTQTIILHDNPVAGFELPQICQLQPFSLQDTSSIQEGNIVSWDYAFGDVTNGTSSVQNPTYIYQDAGTFNLVLLAISDFGCVGAVTVPALVDPKPTAGFATQNECLNDVMDFQNQSSVLTGSVDSWEWDFGDLNTDVVQNTSNLYATFGNFTVELMVETDNGCRDTTTQQVEIYQLPVAAFNFNDVCFLDAANFTDQSTTNSGVVNSWDWDLGDNSTENVQGPVSHLYTPPNTYTVELIVQTDVGCWDTIEQDIIIYPMPETDFVADSVCFGQPTNFTDQSSILSGTIATYNWNFGSGATDNQQNPTNIFPQTGYSPVTLLLTSDFGCKDTITKNIRVYVLPEPDFSFIDTCFEDNVDFLNLSQIPEGTNDIYDWNFGDASTSQLINPSHPFPSEGFYQTKLIATSNFGCQDSITKTVEIYPLPQLAFTPMPDEGCQPLEVLFDNQSFITPNYSITDYYWDFGNGLISTEQEPQITYIDSGFYTVMLIGTTAKGCDDTLIRTDVIDVWPRPIAGFQTDRERYAMYFPKVTFEDLSFGATEWYWDFSDGGTSSNQNPVYEYTEAGTYQVVQTVENDYGCDDVFSQRVIVDPAITFYIPNSFTPDNDNLNETFSGYGEGIEEYQMWIFDRWGKQLFYSEEITNEWDGSYLGKQVESGVYVYNFLIVDVNKESHRYTGSVHLFR